MKWREPHYAQITALLSDGQWHGWEEVITALAPLIDSGRAIRRRESDRRRDADRQGWTANPLEEGETSLFRAIWYGQRILARSMLRTMIRYRGRPVERITDASGEWLVRLRRPDSPHARRHFIPRHQHNPFEGLQQSSWTPPAA